PAGGRRRDDAAARGEPARPDRHRERRLHRRVARAGDGRRDSRPLPVLRQRGAAADGRGLPALLTGGRMTLKQMLGLDTRAERYTYANDPVAGYVSAQKVPDKWVATTCGYCSVGCGMFIGVKDGRAVSVRGNPDHKVNRGLLCPKGLSEHYTIRTDNRALYPQLRTGKTFNRIGWDEAFSTLASKFRDVQARFGPGAV